MGFAGLNITYPCKQAVIPLLDDLSDEARAMGAVNTVVPRRPAGRPQHRRRAGAGASSACCRAPTWRAWCCWAPAAPARPSRMRCCAAGSGELVHGGQRRAAPTALAASLNALYPGRRASGCTDRGRCAAGRHRPDPRHAHRHGQAARPAAAGRAAAARACGCEIVYFPLETALLKAARARGCRVADGGGMAVGQAVGAFELFTGRPADAARMDAHFRGWWPRHAS
jgi:shikimate dehydrogenase